MDDSFLLTLKELVLEKQETGSLDEVLSERLQLENQVRRKKRRNEPCGFLSHGICSRLDIRCGERQQYRLPEDEDDRQKPHRCNYRPHIPIEDTWILIVDDDPAARELYHAYFVNCGAAPGRIESTASALEAKDILKQGKIRNRCYSIVMSDVKLGGETGFDLVHHLVERNYNSRVLLASGFYEERDLPRNYLGRLEVVPGQPVVTRFFRKPLKLGEFKSSVDLIRKEMQTVPA